MRAVSCGYKKQNSMRGEGILTRVHIESIIYMIRCRVASSVNGCARHGGIAFDGSHLWKHLIPEGFQALRSSRLSGNHGNDREMEK